MVRRRLAKLRSSDPGPSHHRTVLHQRASDYAKAVAAGVGPRAQHALHWSRSRARDLTRHAQISAELALRRWETKPARFRQRVTLGTGLALVVGIAGLTVWLWPRPAPPPEPHYTLVSLQALPGWPSDTVLEARPALDRSCAKLAKLSPDRSMAIQGHAALRAVTGTVANWQAVCARLDQVPADDPQAFRGFLLRAFAVYAVTSSDADAHGLFTGYFEAHIDAARTRGGRYTIPVYGPPKDLVMESGQGQRRVNGVLEPYTDRAAIEDGALEGKAPVLFWAADAVDLHILHIQGSGRVTLPDGRQTRIGYAANNGQPFVGIGRLVRERGLADGASMPAIRTWLRTHPEDGRALMRENPRYIFFREIAGTGPVGAFGVTLTPLRSLAVDPQFLPLGSLVWLDTTGPDGVPIQRLMAAQDVGSAIKGINRGDVFWGGGEAAFDKAGRMASPGQTYLLVPRPERPVDPLMM
ncbi:murein transglycosylase A [Roseospira marina]|uniref:murein transglycosylase A n=1 Tax=Roseospira marina TaxID=140057 RepID=UPI0014788FAC|nr:MltA domain-containing protein [Roseospira marina]MBB4312256.1 membrane-bound lytic murein transglycosylase A [Roseospira marina]MBB5085728.1 membrane-bound lytic murein transglycosylase A [Roseospira marina]